MRALNFSYDFMLQDKTVCVVQAFVDPNNLDSLRHVEDIAGELGLRMKPFYEVDQP
jgi:hypothetical protein